MTLVWMLLFKKLLLFCHILTYYYARHFRSSPRAAVLSSPQSDLLSTGLGQGLLHNSEYVVEQQDFL